MERDLGNKYKFGGIVSYVSLGLLLLLGLGLLWPMAGLETGAVECTSTSDPSSPECTMTTSVNTNLTTLIRSSIAVALSSRVEMEVTPKARGAFATGGASMKVTTNNTTGYAVYMQTVDDTSELKATNPNVSEVIVPVRGVMTEASFEDNLNTWGYTVESTTTAGAGKEYKAVPKAGEGAIIRTEGVSREDDYTLGFAVAVGVDLPAGLYTNQLVVSVVANPVEVRSLNDLTYMQEMTSEICNITFEGETKELIDTRDNRSYRVTKLKDGNCWMTQNLALTIGVDGEGYATAVSDDGHAIALDEFNTDISSKWGNAELYPPTATFSFKESTGDPGILSVVGSTASWQMKGDSVDYTSWFYQFAAATAGQKMGEVDGSSADRTICPKGWTLPTGATDKTNQKSTFSGLFSAYGIVDDPDSNDEWNVILESPFNFILDGHVNVSQTAINWWNQTNYGFYWTRTVRNSGIGYALMIQKMSTTLNHTAPLVSGFSVRCVAK